MRDGEIQAPTGPPLSRGPITPKCDVDAAMRTGMRAIGGVTKKPDRAAPARQQQAALPQAMPTDTGP